MRKQRIKPTAELTFEPRVYVDANRHCALAVATDGASVFHIPRGDRTSVVRSAVASFTKEYTPTEYDVGVAAHRFLNPTFAELLPTGEAVRVILETIVATYKGKKQVTEKAKAAAGKKVLGAVKYAKNTVARGRPNNPDSKAEKSYAIFTKHYGKTPRAEILTLFQKEAKLTEGGAPTYFYLCLKRMRAEYSKAGKTMPQVERTKAPAKAKATKSKSKPATKKATKPKSKPAKAKSKPTAKKPAKAKAPKTKQVAGMKKAAALADKGMQKAMKDVKKADYKAEPVVAKVDAPAPKQIVKRVLAKPAAPAAAPAAEAAKPAVTTDAKPTDKPF